MPGRITRSSTLILLTLCFSFAAAWAQSEPDAGPGHFTITATGTLGPVIKGNDVLRLNNQDGTIVVTASETQSHIKHTTTSATYKLRAGSVTITTGDDTDTVSKSSMKVVVLSTGCALQISGEVLIQKKPVTFVDYIPLAQGSFTSAALKHPQPLQMSPQNLTQPSSYVKYHDSAVGSRATLGFSGTISNTN